MCVHFAGRERPIPPTEGNAWEFLDQKYFLIEHNAQQYNRGRGRFTWFALKRCLCPTIIKCRTSSTRDPYSPCTRPDTVKKLKKIETENNNNNRKQQQQKQQQQKQQQTRRDTGLSIAHWFWFCRVVNLIPRLMFLSRKCHKRPQCTTEHTNCYGSEI